MTKKWDITHKEFYNNKKIVSDRKIQEMTTKGKKIFAPKSQ